MKTATKKLDPRQRLNPSVHKLCDSKLPYVIWKKLIYRMLACIVEEVLSNPLGFLLPLNMGKLVVVKIKSRKIVDYIALCKTGESKRQHNWHTFGHVYRIDWVILSTTHFANRTLYRFKACRTMNRQLAQRIFAGQDYLPVSDGQFRYS